MNGPGSRVRRALVSRSALDGAYGDDVVERLRAIQAPVEILETDDAVRRHPLASAAGSVLVLRDPEMGWITIAEHGSLAVRPGERYLNPVAGCRSSCTYCFLRASSVGLHPLRLHVGLEGLFRAIDDDVREGGAPGQLYCTGELADSLGDADLFPVAAILASYFADRTDGRLELRTKSDRVERLLSVEHRGRTTVGFTLSPQQQIDRAEPGTASLAARVRAAAECQRAGYPIAFKLEPILMLDGWRESYREMLGAIAGAVDMSSVEHASIGCLRWSEALGAVPAFAKNHHDALESATWIEYRPGHSNGTLPRALRLDVYGWMRDQLRASGFAGPVWWSLEEPQLLEMMDAR